LINHYKNKKKAVYVGFHNTKKSNTAEPNMLILLNSGGGSVAASIIRIETN
jgi:hypothetical protein